MLSLNGRLECGKINCFEDGNIAHSFFYEYIEKCEKYKPIIEELTEFYGTYKFQINTAREIMIQKILQNDEVIEIDAYICAMAAVVEDSAKGITDNRQVVFEEYMFDIMYLYYLLSKENYIDANMILKDLIKNSNFYGCNLSHICTLANKVLAVTENI